MNLTAETTVLTPPDEQSMGHDLGSDRRADIEARQALIAAFLKENSCDGLLVLEPENFSWLTSGAAARGVLDPRELPAAYYSAEQRWVICSNVDSQRLFDDEVDGLGFQLKEWPWHWDREQLIADLCQGRTVACDRPLNGCKVVNEKIRKLRRKLTPYEQACLAALGQIISHAVEATCRTMTPGNTEREIAGQLSHRLLHRGAHAVAIEVAADGRSRYYRNCGFTPQHIERHCLITVTARKYGLCASTSRAVCFGEPEADVRKEHDAACKVGATYIASTWPDCMPKQILTAGKHVYRLTGFEHEWRQFPQGHVTGRAPVEYNLTPASDELLGEGWAICWHASVGAALSSDTFIISEKGPQLVTPPEAWPLKRIRVQGAEFFRPDLLIR